MQSGQYNSPVLTVFAFNGRLEAVFSNIRIAGWTGYD